MRFSEGRLAGLRCGPGVERRVHIWEPERPRAVILAIHGGMAHGGDYVMPAWTHPVFAVVAGADKLADPDAGLTPASRRTAFSAATRPACRPAWPV
jgi:hypothetical protein